MTDERGFERTTELRLIRNVPSREITGIEQKWVRYHLEYDQHGNHPKYVEESEWREVETQKPTRR